MTAYQVFGKARVWTSDEEEHIPSLVEIDTRVEDVDAATAQEQVEAGYIKIEWDYVEVVDLSKEVPIRSRETELELLARWNEGRGLPAKR